MVNFSKGTEVEVIREDDNDAWFAATVIRSIATSGGVSVEFKTLFSGKERSKPLKETVHHSDVRPLPPPDDSARAFEPGDEVEALHNGGWRAGTVTRVLENSGFLVILSNTEEAKAFARSELRVLRDWIEGRWVAGLEQKKFKMDLDGGTPVEVCTDEEGFEGAWFAAKVVKPIGRNKFMVEYQNLRTDDETEPLRENVPSKHVRPVPPEILERSFSLFEEVDALYNDAWWVGVISEMVKDSRYNVYFRSTREELEFSHSELRPHQDWINGKWVRASQELKLFKH